ncbi:hypothetical protein M436DRAFT_61423 [Aureobasidium namibiae CBS 147.97]|uniref:Uncharacterized protein n=1 Tax=Aureobasidium namibiae CBS 147.97 TaxID=1043004 RepID=A0A074WSR1_9PEZI
MLRHTTILDSDDEEGDYIQDPIQSDDNAIESDDYEPPPRPFRRSRINEEEETSVQTQSSKRRTKKDPPAGRKKRRASPTGQKRKKLMDGLIAHAKKGGSQENTPEGSNSTDGRNSRNLDVLVNKCGMSLRSGAVSDYTPTPGRLLHVSEFENQGRDWQIIQIETRNITRGDDTFPVWWATPQDLSRPGSHTIVPYRLNPRGARERITRNKVFVGHGPYPIPDDGCLELHICPTKDDAIALCTILCDILNRFPEDLPVDNWNATWGHGGLKGAPQNAVRFVEVAALFAWNPHVDIRRIGTPFKPYTKADKRRGAYGQMLSIELNKDKTLIQVQKSE